MTGETVEQLKDRLRKEDEGKEEAFQKRLEQLRADTAKYRAEKEAEERTKQQERERLLAGVRESREREMKDSALRPWLDAGGTDEEEFEREWPAMRTQMLRERALSRGSEARRQAHERNLRTF
jgi:hypothetical protein